MTSSDKRYAVEMQQYAAEEYKIARENLDTILRSTEPKAWIVGTIMWAIYAQTEGDAFARCARRAMGVE